MAPETVFHFKVRLSLMTHAALRNHTFTHLRGMPHMAVLTADLGLVLAAVSLDILHLLGMTHYTVVIGEHRHICR